MELMTDGHITASWGSLTSKVAFLHHLAGGREIVKYQLMAETCRQSSSEYTPD